MASLKIVISLLIVILSFSNVPHASALFRRRLHGTCESKSQAQCTAPDCVWCRSAAVGAACYTPAEAKRLPPAIFDCKPDGAPQATCEYKSESQCVEESCVWCRSAAVAPACYTPEQAARLPASVFACTSGPSRAEERVVPT